MVLRRRDSLSAKFQSGIPTNGIGIVRLLYSDTVLGNDRDLTFISITRSILLGTW